ncbi:unnamed protein product [Leptidea sinapis]|uniref:Uncharacterized protein n=1 Tax=Leptidea sinapis TaxID=189913 RepID=A0A5E4PSD2_9NEOP|nr:unnamed protein product [Leptidea sinapis]
MHITQGEVLLAPLDLVQDMYFGVIGIALFSVSGGMILSARTRGSMYPRTGDSTMAIVGAALALLNALIMIFDLSLAYLDSEQCDDDVSEAVSAAADAYIDAWWSAAGAALFATCGALTLHDWRDVPNSQRRTFAQAVAVCSLATAAFMLLDAVLALCSAHKDEASIRSKCTKRSPRN